MAIPWNVRQLREIGSALSAYPAGSSKCAAAARRVLPVARQLHPDAYGVQLLPTDAAPFLLTVAGHRKFYHHVVVEVIDHRVDALTGTPGHPTHTYLDFYFQYPEAICESAVDVTTVDPGIQSDE